MLTPWAYSVSVSRGVLIEGLAWAQVLGVDKGGNYGSDEESHIGLLLCIM